MPMHSTPKPPHERQLNNQEPAKREIEVPARECPIQNDTLAHHAGYALEQPGRAKEMQDREDDAGDDAEIEVVGEDGH